MECLRRRHIKKTNTDEKEDGQLNRAFSSAKLRKFVRRVNSWLRQHITRRRRKHDQLETGGDDAEQSTYPDQSTCPDQSTGPGPLVEGQVAESGPDTTVLYLEENVTDSPRTGCETLEDHVLRGILRPEGRRGRTKKTVRFTIEEDQLEDSLAKFLRSQHGKLPRQKAKEYRTPSNEAWPLQKSKEKKGTVDNKDNDLNNNVKELTAVKDNTDDVINSLLRDDQTDNETVKDQTDDVTVKPHDEDKVINDAISDIIRNMDEEP